MRNEPHNLTQIYSPTRTELAQLFQVLTGSSEIMFSRSLIVNLMTKEVHHVNKPHRGQNY